MAVKQFDPVAEIVACVTLTFRNWVLATPAAVATLLTFVPILVLGGAGLLSMIFSGGSSGNPMDAVGTMVPSLFAGIGISVIVGVVLGIIALAATYVGADDVLHGRPVDLTSVVQRGAACFGRIFVLFLIVAGVGFAVDLVVFGLTALTHGLLGIILIPALFCAVLACWYFLLYVMPAIVLGNLSPVSAITESIALARANVGITFAVIVSLIIAVVCTWIASAVLHFIPVLGLFAGLAISGLYQAFQAIVLSKIYLNLKGNVFSAQPTAYSPPPTAQ
jgi:hypothetical protein